MKESDGKPRKYYTDKNKDNEQERVTKMQQE